MALDKAMKNLKFDVRLTEFNLNNGLLSKEELQQHLAKLPDCGAQSESVNLDGRGGAATESSDGSTH